MADYSYPYSMFTDYFLTSNGIDTGILRNVESVNARELICSRRFDLMAKWIYIDSYEKGKDMTNALKIYKDNINAFSAGTCCELGSESKTSFDGYVKEFNELIDSIKNNGFDEHKSLIPVAADNAICDGAHRVAIAAYYNKNVSIVRFEELHRNFNYRYFRKNLMCDINMMWMAKQYAEIFSNKCRMVIWYTSNRHFSGEITCNLEEYYNVVYAQDVFLSANDIANLKKVAGKRNAELMCSRKYLKYGGVIHTALIQKIKEEPVEREKTFSRKAYNQCDLYYVSNSVDELNELTNLIYGDNDSERKCTKYNKHDSKIRIIPYRYRKSGIVAMHKKMLENNMYGYGEDSYNLNRLRIAIKWPYIKRNLQSVKLRIKSVILKKK